VVYLDIENVIEPAHMSFGTPIAVSTWDAESSSSSSARIFDEHAEPLAA